MMTKLHLCGVWLADMSRQIWASVLSAKNVLKQTLNQSNQETSTMLETYHTNPNGLTIFWQVPKRGQESVGEPALVLKKYMDVLEIRQESRTILITLSCVPEFIKAIQRTMKEP